MIKTNIKLDGEFLFSMESDWSAESLAAWFAGFGETWSLLGGEGDLASWYCDRLNRISFGEDVQWLDRMVALTWWVAENGEPGPEIDLIDCIKPETLH